MAARRKRNKSARLLHRRTRRLGYESLEQRQLLAITVDTLVDEVDGSIVDGDISLRDAIAAAPGGETIDFDASLDGGTILLTMGELSIRTALTVDATALVGGLTIDASGNDPTPDEDNGDGSRIFNIDDGDDETGSLVTIGGLTLTGGDVSGYGGAIHTVERQNLTSSTITGNSADGGGGGIFARRSVTVTSSTISGNYGSGIVGSNVMVNDSTISGNYGGGIDARGSVTVTSSTITGNDGSAIFARALGNVTVSSSTISGNDGSGIVGSNVMVNDSTISGNYGGGIDARGSVTVTSSTITGNDGSAIFARGHGDVTVSSSTISGNGGGGIYARGSVTVNSSTITGNDGSAIFVRDHGNVTVSSSTISGNGGGGIYPNYGNVTVSSSTISGNVGGVLAGYNATIDNSIVAGNTDSGTAPDIRPGDGALAVRYSLIGDNTGSGMTEAPVGMPDAEGNQIGGPINGTIDPMLAPLANNGGLTQTHALMLGSPAIDAGDPTLALPPPFDQRDTPFVRIYGGRIDIGAYERQLVVDTLSDESDSDFSPGDLSLREAVELANGVTLSNVITFDASLDGGAILLSLGELSITNALTIDAATLPGGVTIDASGNDPTPEEGNGDGSRVFNIDDSNAAADSPVVILGLTLTGGDVSGDGGAIFTRETLRVTNSTISGNSANNYQGGGISASGNLTVESTTISDNSASTGGGIYAYEGNVTVSSSTISGNSANQSGGGIQSRGDVTVTSSTISDNSVRFFGGSSGGGIQSWGDVTVTSSTISDNSVVSYGGSNGGGIQSWGDVTVTSSTISGNSVRSEGSSWGEINGGGIQSWGDVTVTSSTISGNSVRSGGNHSSDDGGGIQSAGDATVTIENSIVAGNDGDGSGLDLGLGTRTPIVRYSLIGDNTGTGLAEAPVGAPDADGNLIGDPDGMGIIDPMLAPLADNNGPTQMHTLMAGSPAINAGDPIAVAGTGDVPLFDQRGAPFRRVAGGRIDMGAHERQDLTVDILEVATPTLVPVDEVTIEFSSEVSGFDTDDVELSLNGGPNLLTESQTLTTTDNQTFVLGGLADVTTGSRFYTLRLVSAGSDIVDASGGPLDAGDTINWFMGPLVLGLTVDTLIDEADGNIDDGDVSLRDALAAAVPGETIEFDASLDGGTILLTMGELAVTKAVTIDATALPSGLTIDASGNDPTPEQDNGDGSRVFNIDDGTGSRILEVSIRGLRLVGGDIRGSGGAIFTRENLTVTGSTISGNSASSATGSSSNGGGIYALGAVTVTGSTISGNSITGDSARGGGISGSTVTVTNSTISENSAQSSAGGISGGDVTVTNSTISGNSADFVGGISGGAVTVTNSTISGNSADRVGGGIFSGSRITIESSIVAGNTDGGSAPDLQRGTGRLTVRHSLIGDNTGNIGVAEAPVGMPSANGNLIGGPIHGSIDPLLAPLADNGGPTQTHLLLPWSPAVNAGDPTFTSPPNFDQRGASFDRVVGGRIDMGAYELQTIPTSILIVDQIVDELDTDFGPGDLSLREAVGLANNFIGPHTIRFDPSLDGETITLTLGELLITNAMTIDASSLVGGLTIDASGTDPTPEQDNEDGSRVFNIDDSDDANVLTVTLSGLTLTGGDKAGWGGAIRTREDLTLTRSTITDNSARTGGAIRSVFGLTVVSSTISGNRANDQGGGIAASGSLTVESTTISGNSADIGGGIWAVDDPVTIEHSIVAGNTDGGTAPDMVPGTGTQTVRYSLIGDNTGTTLIEAPVGMPNANGNLIGGPTDGIIDPLLGPLADNGGPTQTHALMAGSPAIDAGDPGFTPPPDFDQRGDPFARVFGGRIDMGAYERQIGDMDFDGDIDYDDIVALVLGLTDLDAYEVLYRALPNANGDTDGDGDQDFDDISRFVELLDGEPPLVGAQAVSVLAHGTSQEG